MATEMITLEINGKTVEVPKGTSILNAAKAAHIKIPTLCYHPDLKPSASCGICVVRQLVPSRNPADNGKFVPSPKLLRACCTEATPGMKILTHDPDIVQVRRTVLELILANHPSDCLQCPRSGSCELQALAADFGIRDIPFPKEVIHHDCDTSTPSIALITNFHLPESTLIMLVSALAGRENILNAYNIAVDEKYRFFSFGDAMFIS